MDYMDSIWEQYEAARKAAFKAAEQAAAQQAAEQARKQAEFQLLKNNVDKVYFSYTLQRATDEKLTEWAQWLSDGVSSDLLVSIMRSDNSSMYYGAGRESSINNAFVTLFGRLPTVGESARYSAVDAALIPGLVALEATGSDAETMYMRLQGAQAIRDYYQSTNIPLSYGMPAMKAKEQLLTLKAGPNAVDSVNDAVREMSEFLVDWGRTINRPLGSQGDISPPSSKYVYKDADTVGVAYYEPPSASGNGRFLFTFNEPVDWSSLDDNRDGRLDLFTELDVILENPRIFGDNPTLITKVGVNSIVINVGMNASSPYSSHTANDKLVLGDLITFVEISDYQGASGSVVFAVNGWSDTAPSALLGAVPQVAGNIVVFSFSESMDWGVLDKNRDGVITLGYENSGAELAIRTSEANMLGSTPTIGGYLSNTLTIKMSADHTYGNVAVGGVADVDAGKSDLVTIIGVTDMHGNKVNANFDSPF